MKVVYLADPIMSGTVETLEEEFELQANGDLKEANIIFNAVECTSDPMVIKRKYDILFFDYGGMSFGNSMLESLCRFILTAAEDNPSRLFCMVSRFTKAAMQDAMGSMSSKFPNLFLEIDDFIRFYKEVWMGAQAS